MASVKENRVSKAVINAFMVDAKAPGARIWSWRRRWREESQGTALLRFAGWACGQGKLTFDVRRSSCRTRYRFLYRRLPAMVEDLRSANIWSWRRRWGEGSQNPAQVRRFERTFRKTNFPSPQVALSSPGEAAGIMES